MAGTGTKEAISGGHLRIAGTRQPTLIRSPRV